VGAPARFSLFAWQKAVRDDASLTSTQKLVALVLSTYMTAKTGADAHPVARFFVTARGCTFVPSTRRSMTSWSADGCVSSARVRRLAGVRSASRVSTRRALHWEYWTTGHLRRPIILNPTTGSPGCKDRESWTTPSLQYLSMYPRAKRHRLDPATEHGRTVGSTLGLDEPAGRQELRDRWSSNSEALGRAFGAFERARAAREATA